MRGSSASAHKITFRLLLTNSYKELEAVSTVHDTLIAIFLVCKTKILIQFHSVAPNKSSHLHAITLSPITKKLRNIQKILLDIRIGALTGT